MATDAAATRVHSEPSPRSARYVLGMQRLLRALQELSLTRDLVGVQAVVSSAARELTGCDGAAIIMRDGDQCYFADEDSIAPLWKGRRFPMSVCVSGWVMNQREAAVIPDIYRDPRVPHEAYRSTYVKSLAVVPIRTLSPIGTLANYWAHEHGPTAEDVELLQALADATSVAIENVRVYNELEQRVRNRTLALERANQEIQSLSITDELTGLLNRRGFYQMAERALAVARRGGSECVIAFIDVDGLKAVNDRLGHDVGDRMITDVADVLLSTLRESDVVGRMGGDEFCVVGLHPDPAGNNLHDRLQARLAELNAANDRPYKLAVSIGCLHTRHLDRVTLDQLLVQADERMYQDKRSKTLARAA